MADSTASARLPARGGPLTGNPRVDRMLQGMLGSTRLERCQLAATEISLHFRADDDYFSSDELIARLTIGAAFGLLHRCGLERAVFTFVRHGEAVRLSVAKADFNAFFGLSGQEMARLAADPERFERSAVRAVSEQRQWEFFLQFSKSGA